MDDFTLIVLGLVMYYSWGHFIYLSFTKTYNKRSTYEQAVTWLALVMFAAFFVGSI